MKDIYFILPGITFGGAERVIFTLCNGLDQKYFKPYVVLFSARGMPLDLLNKNVEVIDLKSDRIRKAFFPLIRLLIKKKPDFVFGGWGEVSVLLAPFIKLFPKIKFIARETNVVSRHVTRPEIKFFYRFYNNYHKIICQSEDMYQDLVQNFKIKKEKLVKINNPVDLQAIDAQLLKAAKPEEYSSEYKNVVAIGNLSHRKGFDHLLHVFSYLKDEKIKLHILGDGRDREVLLQMKGALELEHVLFHGLKKNPYPYLKFADLFVLSSRYEGFPNVLLEAGACGTYALVNDCPGGIREIILPGVNGEICNIEDYSDFSEKIKELVTRKYDPIKIREAISKRYSKEIILKKYEDLFKNCI